MPTPSLPRALALASLALVLAAPARARAQDTAFDAAVDAYFADYPAVNPTSATDLGLHEHDEDLEDLSPKAVTREIARQHAFAERFATIDEKTLAPAKAIDLEVVRHSIEATLLELEKVQGFRHRADFYSDLANQAVYVLVKRSFAPPADRLASVCAREEKIPRLLEQARANLERVPAVNVAITLDELPGIVSFFKEDVPNAFPTLLGKGRGPFALDSPEAKLVARFRKASDAAIAALGDYEKFVREKLAPGAPEDFALGEDLFRAKLRAEEMLDEPLDPLLARGQAELARLQGELEATAAKIDPKKSVAEVLALVTADHPAPGQVIAETQARLASLKEFLVAKKIVTIPSDVMPTVEETPAFMRATTMASMSTPGPFETRATEAFYNLTLPDPAWDAAKVEDWMRGALSRPTLDVTSIHEAFPGHYVQFLWLPRVTSKVRKFTGASSNAEGWAHYCEQMVLDEGFGEGDPKLRLAQIRDALLRAARYVCGIRMHARGMKLDEAIHFFQDQGFQSKDVAEVEARRGTEDPTYLYYTWGKLEILRLREDVKKARGSAFSLAKFHDDFLAQGSIPLPLVRRALLGDEAAHMRETAREPAETAPITSEVARDIRRWTKALESKNGWVSLDALEYLPYFGRAAVPALLEELAAESSNGRCLAAVALAKIPDARAVEPLLARLGDKGPLELRTLTEDGEDLADVYPSPELTVGQQARIALEAITGEHHAKAAGWRAWWERARATFQPKPLPPESAPALPPEARWLEGLRIVIDPGHGGDRQKRGYKRGLTYLSEADVNLRVARYLRDLLVRAGAEPFLTRDGDGEVTLKARAHLAAERHADVFLSIHHNWSPKLDQVNTSTWYHLAPDEKPASIDIARHVQAGVFEALGLEHPPASGGLMSDRLMYEHGFGVLRDLPADVPGCLCEATYYSNFTIEKRLRDLAFLEKEAWGFFMGLARYMAAGVPRAEVASASSERLVLAVADGIEERGSWTLPHQVFGDTIVVRVDGQVVAATFDRAKGRISVAGPFAPGEHEATVNLENVNANHSWPKRLRFTVK